MPGCQELLAWNRRERTWTYNHLIRKQTPNHLAKLGKWLSCIVSKEFLEIQATREPGFTLKLVRDVIITYNQMHSTDKYSHNSSIIWPVLLIGWLFVYELSGCGLESSCSHLNLNLRYPVCSEQAVSWRSGNYRISETRTWHDKNKFTVEISTHKLAQSFGKFG